ncbi:hypothetical protein Q9189_001890 [Teloschistes chrysophthalmus]
MDTGKRKLRNKFLVLRSINRRLSPQAHNSHAAHLAKSEASSTPTLFKIDPGKIEELRKRMGNQIPIFVHESLNGEKDIRIIKADSKKLLTLTARSWDDTHSFWSVRYSSRDYIVAEQPSIRGRIIYKRLLDLGRMDRFEAFTFAYAANEIRPDLPCSNKSTTAPPPREQTRPFIPDPLHPTRDAGVMYRVPASKPPLLSSNLGRKLPATELDDEDGHRVARARSRATAEEREKIYQKRLALLQEQKTIQKAEDELHINRLRELSQQAREDSAMDTP